MKRYTDDLESAGAVMMTLAMMIESRDGSAEGHCHRIANHAVSIGRQLGLQSEAPQTLRRGGFLHDIGMLAIPDWFLHKPGSLEPEEYALGHSTPVVGDSLIAGLRSLQPVVRSCGTITNGWTAPAIQTGYAAMRSRWRHKSWGWSTPMSR